MDEPSDYERIRKENIERNEDFLRSIGLDSVKPDMSSAAKKKDPSKRGVSKRKAPVQAIPTRRSGRVTIERLKAEDFSKLTKEEREKKQSELDAMIEAKASASYTPSAEEVEESRYVRLSRDPISLFPAYNQPQTENYEDTEDAKEREQQRMAEQQSDEAKAWVLPILDTLESISSPTSKGTTGKAASSKKSSTKTTPTKVKAEKGAGANTDRLKSLKVADDDVAKVTESRITAVWVHPSEEKLIVVAGDKQGYIGLWDVDSQENDGNGNSDKKIKREKSTKAVDLGDKYDSRNGVDGVWKYRPHVSAICRIYSAPSAPSDVHTVSYDGTVRVLDLNTQAWVSKFEAPSDLSDLWWTDAWGYGEGVNYSTAGSADKLFVSRSDGYVSLIDFRTGSKARGASSYAWSADMGYKTQSVQHFPTNEHLILTCCGGAEGDISLYDIRTVGGNSKKNSSVVTYGGHSKSANAAYASPNGQCVVSFSQDDTIRLWSNFLSVTAQGKVSAGNTVFSSRNHNNHTGRWLSTFRPTWDPKFPASFVSGSMAQPRCIEVFTASAGTASAVASLSTPLTLRSDWLASVCSRNAVHPTQDIIAAANSSGRVHVLR